MRRFVTVLTPAGFFFGVLASADARPVAFVGGTVINGTGAAAIPDGQGFAAFGRVVRGMEVVRKIQKSSATDQHLTAAIRVVRVTRKAASPSGSH